MENMMDSGSLDTLVPGQVLAVQARKVANGKMSIEVAEIIITSGSDGGFNLVKMANKGDDRFSIGGARRAWLTGTPEGLSEMFTVDFSSLTFTVNERGHEIASLNILNPVIAIETAAGVEEHAVVVQVTETTEPTEWQSLNKETSAKRRGADGDICCHQSMPIYANTSVALARTRKHLFLEMDPVTQASTVNVDTNTGEIFS